MLKTFAKCFAGACLLMAFAVSAETVRYSCQGQALEGFYLSAGQDAPLVMLVHDWDGPTDYEFRRAEMLHEAGYSVFVADIYGAGIRPVEVADKRHHTGELYRDRGRMRGLINTAIQKAAELGANIDNSVMIGYCLGGTAVLEMARAGTAMQGFVAIHGGLGTPAGQDYRNVKADILVQHGAADANISMAEFAALSQALEKDGAPNEMISYGGARHSFTKFDNPKYHPEADKKSWQRLLTFLQSQLR